MHVQLSSSQNTVHELQYTMPYPRMNIKRMQTQTYLQLANLGAACCEQMIHSMKQMMTRKTAAYLSAVISFPLVPALL